MWLTANASIPPTHHLPSNKQTTQLNPVVASAAKPLWKDNMKTIFSVERSRREFWESRKGREDLEDVKRATLWTLFRGGGDGT